MLFRKLLETQKISLRQKEANLKIADSYDKVGTLTTSQKRRHVSIRENAETYACIQCTKCFTTRSGLWKHKQYGGCARKEIKDNSFAVPEPKKNMVENEEDEWKDLILDVVKQNSELTKHLLDMSKQQQQQTQPQNSYNNNTFQQNSNNQNHTHFNMQVFLNETCKDAINIGEFVDSVKISLQDIERVGSLGYVEGISQIILRNLKQLDVCKRPIHCSDVKREIIHIKAKNNVWERESDIKPLLVDTIKHIAHKNVLQIRDWKAANPDYRDSECKKNDIYMRIVNESMGACDKEEDAKNYSRIIQKIAKETTIEK